MKFKAVCSGGGTRVGVFAGAFAFLEEQGWTVEEGVGVSAGALFLGALSSGRSARECHELNKEFLPSRVLDPRILGFWPFADGTKGFFKGKKILKAIRKNYPKDYGHAVFPLHVGVHNWTRRVQEVLSAGDLPLHIRASMSLPIFDMVSMGGELFEDGGTSGNFLLDYTGWKLDNASPVLGFSFKHASRPRKHPKNKKDRLVGTLNDLMHALDREHTEDGVKMDAQHVVLETSYGSLDLDMDEDDADLMFQEGYDSAKKWWNTKHS